MTGRGAEVVLRRPLERRPEDRVLEVVGVADSLEEREPRLLQVPRLPAWDKGVDGDHDRRVAGDLGAADEALGELGIVRPVELVPARGVAGGGGDLLHRVGGGGAGDEREPEPRRRAGARELAVGMDDRLRSDRRQEDGRREIDPGDARRQVAVGDVAQHPRHDPPALERGTVGAHRRSAAGARVDVGRGSRLHRLLRGPLELPPVNRERLSLAAEAAHVDLAVVVGERGRRVAHAGDPTTGRGSCPYLLPICRPWGSGNPIEDGSHRSGYCARRRSSGCRTRAPSARSRRPR